jgi:Sulfotransferase domain
VRYEDLVLDPGATLKRLLEHIGVESSDEIVGRMVEALAGELAELAEHRTTADPRASIGRWRRDLSEELLGACDEAFGPALEAFGYER